VVRAATGGTTTEAWWTDDRLRIAAADAHHTLSRHVGAALDLNPAQPVANAISATARTLRTLSTSRPYAADIVDRYPELQRLARRDPTGVPAAVIGHSDDQDAEIAAQRDIALIERAGGEYELDLDAGRWPRELAEMLVGRISAWLTAAAVDVGRPVGELVVLGEQDRRLLARVNDTATPVPGVCLHQLVEQQVGRAPEAVAVEHGGRRLMYRELDERAEQLAARLRAGGVGRGDLVGVCLSRSPRLVVALLAVLKAGAAYVPLDPQYPPARLRFMVADSRPAVVLGESGSVDWLFEPAQPVWDLDIDAAQLPVAAGSGLPGPVSPDDLAYVIYTSGSTGQPNGVMITHHAAVNHMTWMQTTFSLDATDAVLQKTPVSFDASTWEFFAPLVAGARVVLAPPAAHRDPGVLLDLIETAGVTILQVVPTLLRALIQHGELARCISLRRIFCGGEPLDGELWRKLRNATPAPLVNLYGPTEATIDATYWTCEGSSPHAAPPIGGPVANTTVYVLDEQGRQVPVGVPGELYIGGAGLARGYLNRPELTAERFTTGLLPDEPATRLYRTGDLVTLRPDGNLHYHGRVDDQVKIRGHRIEPAEIEIALADHPAVEAAAVTCHTDDHGQPHLAAYVVTVTPTPDLATELRRHLRTRLPEAMIPSAVVTIDALPLAPNGKLDRRALPPPAPDHHTPPPAAPAGPATSVEGTLTTIWQHVLHLHHVNPHDNFLDLGGDSLDLMRVRARIDEDFGVHLSIADLFQHPTVRSQAEAVASRLLGNGANPNTTRHTGGGTGSDNNARPTNSRNDPIAIVGLACRFPGAGDAAEFWNRLLSGDELIGPSPDHEAPQPDRSGTSYVRAHGPIAHFDQFDATFFGYSVREAEVLDPQQRVFLELAWEALEDAGIDPERNRSPVGVFAGTGHNGYLLHHLLPNRQRLDPHGQLSQLLGGSLDALHLLVANDKDFLAPRVSYRLNLTGPSITVQSGCSTSLVAVHLAVQSLRSGECGVALAGGVSIRVPDGRGYWFEPGGITSPDGHCRPFDANAAGTVFTSGAGVVVLKRLGDAVRDGDAVYAVIRGSAVNNDGATKIGFTAPSVTGHADAVRRALTDAAVAPTSVGYLEAHGTGTVLGDPVEIAALGAAFTSLPAARGPCLIGSVKGNIGHTDVAAGIASLIKVALALRYGVIPPSINFERPNSEIDFSATPFTVVTRRMRWLGKPRRAGVSSLGVGGTNAHMVLEQPPAVPPSERPEVPHLLVASAPSARQLQEVVTRLHRFTHAASAATLADAAHTLRTGRRQFPHRCYWLAGPRRGSEPGTEVRVGQVPNAPPQIAFLFPGQSVQYPGMGRYLYQRESAYRRAFDECSDILQPLIGVDLREAVMGQPSHLPGHLASTEFAQPALFAVMYALATTLRCWGFGPAVMVGHSLGEIVAATVADVFSLDDALRFVAVRGAAMAACVSGAMLAVRATPSDVRHTLPVDLTVAALNGPTEVVVAGPDRAIARYARQCRRRDWSVRRLSTNRAFHSPEMLPAIGALTTVLERVTLREPQLPIVSTVTGDVLGAEARNPTYWIDQAIKPVLFGPAIDRIAQLGRPIMLEVGPGNVLTSLARRGSAAAATITAAPIPGRRTSWTAERAVILDALGRLWLAGADVDWARVEILGRARKTSLPTYPFDRQRFWLDPPGRSVPDEVDEHALLRADDEQTIVRVPGWSRRLLCSASTRVGEARRAELVLYVDRGEPLDPERFAMRMPFADAVRVRRGDRFDRLGTNEFIANPTAEDHHRRLFETLASEGRSVDHVLYAWPLIGLSREARLELDPAGMFRGLLFAYRGWRRAFPSAHGTIDVVGRGGCSVLDSESPSPAHAQLTGLVTVIAQEDQLVNARYLDLDGQQPEARHHGLAVGVLDAVLGDRPNVAAVRGRHLWVPEYRPIRLPEPSGTAKERTWVILGGLGRLGLLIAEHLASYSQARLVLAGRTDPCRPAVADRSNRVDDTLRRIKDAGGQIGTAHVDVTQRASIDHLLDAVETDWGRIDYIVHAAGVTGPAATVSVAEMGWKQVEDVLRPKTVGVVALAEALAGRDFDRCILFSSSSAILGGLGLGSYASANAFLDAFAAMKHNAGDDRWVSINWDAWTGTTTSTWSPGSHPSHAEIAPHAAIVAMTRIAELSPCAQALVVNGDFDSRHQRWTRPTSLMAGQASEKRVALARQAASRPAIADADAAAAPAGAGALTRLAAIWTDVLGQHDIGPSDRFRDIGGDSLAATRVAARIRHEFAVKVPLCKVLKARTLADLAALLDAVIAENDGRPGKRDTAITCQEEG
jgi:amino acid adenylation domain-containing protein